MRPYRMIFTSLVLVIVTAGCTTPIGVDRVGFKRAYQQINATALTGSQLSADTLSVFARYGLADLLQKSPDVAIARLQEQACKDSRRDVLFALAEASYGAADRYADNTWVTIHEQGQKTSVTLSGSRVSRAYYFASAVYAYFYLFGDGNEPVSDTFDPHLRTACDFYNRGLAQALTPANSNNVELVSRELHLPVGTVSVTATRPGFPWSVAQFHEFVASDEFLLRGIEPRERVAGLGVPLIAIPDRAAFGTNWPSYYAPGLKVPASVLLRIEGSVCDMTSSRLKATLELYSSYDVRDIKVGKQTVPLASDLSATLAYGLQHSIQWKARMVQFFTGRELIKSGIYLTQPYEPGKIPVVFVYGTAGSQSDWAQAFNTLQSDPAVSARYQFWFLVYNTGNPLAYSGMLLRTGLEQVVKELDPQGKDPALRNMVVIGHSQGGLVTKLAAVDGGDKLWSLVSDKPLDQLNLKPADRELLGDCMIFQHSPYVKTVVLACAPNLGSICVNNWIQNLAQRLIKMPQSLTQLGTELATLNVGGESTAFKQLHGKVPTSVANMNPDNPFLLRLRDIPLAPGITGHTIIGDCVPGPVDDGNDTVVAYKSAYLPGMESQYVVHCAHGDVPADPLAIEEIRRILLQNVKQ